MKREMKIIELPPIENNHSVVTTELTIRRPGIIRQTSVMAKPTNISVIMQATGRKPQMELVPVAICETDPDEKEEVRKFTVAPPGLVIESNKEVSLKYQGSFIYPQGIILFLFEEVTPWKHPDDGKYCRRCHKGVGFWDAPDEGPCTCSKDQIDAFTKASLR